MPGGALLSPEESQVWSRTSAREGGPKPGPAHEFVINSPWQRQGLATEPEDEAQASRVEPMVKKNEKECVFHRGAFGGTPHAQRSIKPQEVAVLSLIRMVVSSFRATRETLGVVE